MCCDRRTFVTLGAAAFAVAFVPGCASLMTRPVPLENGRVTLDLRRFPELSEPGGVLRVLPAGWTDPVLILVTDDGGFVALSTICTHRGCTVEPAGARLVCPCHGSTYDRQGRVLQGPAERDLARYPARLTPDGLIVIDVGGRA